MKKILSLVLVIVLLLGCSVTFAESDDDLGVTVIGGPETETETVSLDDFKLKIAAEIEGYGILCGTSFEFVDSFYVYNDGWRRSGTEADYAMLRMDILNTTMKNMDYLSACEVKVVYDDTYEFGGWYRQYNFDWSEEDTLMKSDQFAIAPMYEGHYVFGCTLPNAVVTSQKPLKMIITIDGNEITYNIRK